MSDEDDDEFLLFDPGAIEKLKRDRSYFKRAMAQFYVNVAETFGCNITLSDRRIGEAYDFWMEDVERVLERDVPPGTTALDHFKNAAHLAFWLRRHIPINDITFRKDKLIVTHSAQGERADPTQAQVQFMSYGNELCALFVGFYICLAYEVCAMAERDTRRGKTTVVSDAIGVRRLPPHFQAEYPRLLKHKPMSPHALYMLYRSLFDTLEWEGNKRKRSAA